MKKILSLATVLFLNSGHASAFNGADFELPTHLRIAEDFQSCDLAHEVINLLNEAYTKKGILSSLRARAQMNAVRRQRLEDLAEQDDNNIDQLTFDELQDRYHCVRMTTLALSHQLEVMNAYCIESDWNSMSRSDDDQDGPIERTAPQSLSMAMFGGAPDSYAIISTENLRNLRSRTEQLETLLTDIGDSLSTLEARHAESEWSDNSHLDYWAQSSTGPDTDVNTDASGEDAGEESAAESNLDCQLAKARALVNSAHSAPDQSETLITTHEELRELHTLLQQKIQQLVEDMYNIPSPEVEALDLDEIEREFSLQPAIAITTVQVQRFLNNMHQDVINTLRRWNQLVETITNREPLSRSLSRSFSESASDGYPPQTSSSDW